MTRLCNTYEDDSGSQLRIGLAELEFATSSAVCLEKHGCDYSGEVSSPESSHRGSGCRAEAVTASGASSAAPFAS